MINNFFYIIGKKTLDFINTLGDFFIFQLKILFLFFKPPFRIKNFLEQITFIGYGSIGVIFLTGFFTGLVEAVNLYDAFHKFGIDDFMGYTIFISVVKELGPVFAALMVVSRAMSAYAAELGSMRVTEQIDALDVMAVDSRHYLIVPRIMATVIAMPLLILFFDAVANIGSYLISVYSLDVNGFAYLDKIRQFGELSDFKEGVTKGIVFGYLISAISTYIGYNTKGGAKGVGISTTRAVVISSVVVFAADYVISAFYLIF
ncbi:phospholipid/cholesterol/gamma-HCH transport system permease protein [Lebetimonas natsushimae]|uniref:Phospholipid/cholesterol/gamma-HCH transport system permease protein n=1 Tax=Lebetimonas natsushimae TaxID=1936991 RepID=A0A292YEL2_9BACT|nr:ABC transporter permease [Lebetimonas natsushimae]GAX87585.1 phospholipid/cholesterol/gamma-HCH transport system permease protein [Lebetimonas natsushimae]